MHGLPGTDCTQAVRWEALRRGIEFWVQVMRMNESGNAGSLGDW